MKEQVSRKWMNWYQNKVDKEIKGVDSRDKVKRNAEMSYFRQDVGGQARVTMDEEGVL